MKWWRPRSAACLELTSFNDEPGAKSEFDLTWLKQRLSVSTGMQKKTALININISTYVDL